MKKAAAIRGLSCIMPMYMIMPVFCSNSYSSKFISKIMPVYMKSFCLSDMSCINYTAWKIQPYFFLGNKSALLVLYLKNIPVILATRTNFSSISISTNIKRHRASHPPNLHRPHTLVQRLRSSQWCIVCPKQIATKTAANPIVSLDREKTHPNHDHHNCSCHRPSLVHPPPTSLPWRSSAGDRPPRK
jgi:hypothetical protein